VFIDGVLALIFFNTHEGIDVCLLSSALTKPKYKTVIDTYFNQIANKEESLTSLEYRFRQ
jgi:Fe-S cluster assembly protein SufD